MAPLCKFYQQGNCRNGANCRFEHPGSNSNPFGGSDNNRFNALNSGGGGSGGAFGRGSSTGPDGTNAYKVTKDAIKIDLADERPQWILSAYGPGRDAPEQLFGGYPREQSFEELRLSVLASSNPQQTLQKIQTMYLEAENQMQTALGNLDGAVQFILAAENKHPNRHDICRQNTRDGGANGSFAVGNTRSGFGVNTQAANQNPFGAAQANPFGTPAAAPAMSAFGQPSQMGGKPNPFGQTTSTGGSAFGQTSSLGAGNSAFGQTSMLGAGGSAFGQPSSLGAGGSAFGQTSSLGAKPNPFAAASGGPSGFAAAAQQQSSAFGQTSSLGAKPNPFGAPATASPFGAPAQSQGGGAFGAPSQPQNANPFGTPAQPQPSNPSPFGAPSQSSNTGAFGAPTQASSPSPFGAPPPAAASSAFGASSQPAQSSPFGAPSQAQAANPFGAPAQPAAPAANPFGQPAAQPSAFASAPATSNPFDSAHGLSNQGSTTQTAPAALNPFGQPASNGISVSSNNVVNGAGGFGAQPAGQATSTGAKSPYPPGSTKQHPDLTSYTSRMGTRLIRFKNMPVSYKNSNPGVQNGAQWSKIWFPDGPPNYYADTEPQDKNVYTDAVHKLYEDSARTGRFVDVMPEVPPLREDCQWDF